MKEVEDIGGGVCSESASLHHGVDSLLQVALSLAFDAGAVDLLQFLFYDRVQVLHSSLCLGRGFSWRFGGSRGEVGSAVLGSRVAVVFGGGGRIVVFLFSRSLPLVLGALQLPDSLLFAVFFLGLAHKCETAEDNAHDDKEGPLVVLSHEEAEQAVETARHHLVLAVEAQLARVPVARQAVEQVDVPEKTLGPEGSDAHAGIFALDVRPEEASVEDGEARREGGAADIHLVLDAVETPLQRISIRSLVGLALLDRDHLQKRFEQVLLLAVDQPEVCVDQYAAQREQQKREGSHHF